MTIRRPLPGVACALVACALSACDLLEVEHPAVILPEDLENAEALPLIYAGGIRDFQGAFSRAGSSTAVMRVGLFTDEFHIARFNFNERQLDRRDLNEFNPILVGLFQFLNRARVSLPAAADRIQAFDPADPRVPELLGLAGYTYVLIGEIFCSGAPVSTVDENGTLLLGDPLTTAEMFELGIEEFDAALAAGAGEPVLELARIGKARALLALGRHAEAAALARDVPLEYRYRIGHSVNGFDSNVVYTNNRGNKGSSLSDLEGSNGLPFRSANDPRVPWIRDPPDDVGLDRQTPMYKLLTYSSLSDPISVATGTEARLIEAEAALVAGDPAWLTILQDLRAGSGLDFSGVSPLADTGSMDGNVDVLFSERAFWLFATAHRLGDLRRLISQYGRKAEDVFPIGAHHTGGQYGSDVDLMIPATEQVNPNFEGCLRPGA